MLQIDRPRLAIEALVKEDSAEGHYLKAIALQSIGQKDAAQQQISESIAISPFDTKYQGYELLLRMTAGRTEAIEELIKLYDLQPSSPGLAFFATLAFTKRKPPDVRGALKAFDLGMTLIDETPEFMSNALHFAITGVQQTTGQGDEKLHQQKVAAAERLLQKLEQVAPKDVDLLKELLGWAVRGRLVEPSQHLLQRITELNADGPEITELRIMVELMLGQSANAIAVAKQAISDNPGDPKLELMLAEAAWQAPDSPENEKLLADLAYKHPENPEFIAKLVLYMAKGHRLTEAVNTVNQALAKTKAPEQRSALLRLAVGIPLEANDAVLSEQQVARYKSEFHDSRVIEYFEGRVLFLKKDYPAAKAKFQHVISQQQINTDADRKLVAECLIWLQKIVQFELVNAQREAAAKTLENSKPNGQTKPTDTPADRTNEPAKEKPANIPTDKSKK